ncbi:MAG: hypothetical protein EOO30_03425 [Comamonadaceae bacterium]|nr:MAG: hypothetical protein EOO30_03425 [Comamonadaceae bacterium]
MLNLDKGAEFRTTSAGPRGAWIAFAAYFAALLVLTPLISSTPQFPWGTPLMALARATSFGDPVSFATGALDIARHGWITPENQWLIRLWPPGFMVLESVVVRLLGEDGPVLLPLLVLSALGCATWMTLLRQYLLRSGNGPRLAALAPLLPFAFPLSWFFLLSPLGLAFGETFSISLYLTAFLLVLLGLRAGAWWKAVLAAVLAGLAVAGAAYFRSQFELLVLFLTLGGGAIFVFATLAFLFRRKTFVGARTLVIVAVTLVVTHAAMAPWRYHNFLHTQEPRWVYTSAVVFENALTPEARLNSLGAGFIVAGGGHLACKLEPAYCGQKDEVHFYGAFRKNMGEWLAYKAQLVAKFWMAPPKHGALSSADVPSSVLQKALNLAFLAILLAGLWRLWAIRREPEFPLQAWVQLSTYGCLLAVYALVHLEARYFYLPKIFSVVAVASLMSPRRAGSSHA